MKASPLLLGYNGTKFSNPHEIEYATDSTRRTRVFYCDPRMPNQKGSLEENHGLIRRVLPKGKSFDQLNQSDINLVMNHVKSYSRKKLANKTPCETFKFFYGQELLDKLGAELIPPNEVILRPDLVKSNAECLKSRMAIIFRGAFTCSEKRVICTFAIVRLFSGPQTCFIPPGFALFSS